MSVLISSERFGDVDCEESSTLSFPRGLLGFEDQTAFAVVPVDEDGIYSWLQSANDPALAFLVTSPHFFFADYEPDVDDADLAELDLTDPSETLVLCLLTVGEDSITANLLGPVVVNTRTRVARQVVLTDNRWSTRESLSGS
ncbi:MAG: flagellar assembly protein FliW [Acidimicrobiales bacterium]